MFIKHDTGKPRPGLIPPGFLLDVAAVMAHGAAVYGDRNYRDCPDPERYIDAAFRHLLAYHAGETHDPDTGLSHLAHAACCLGIRWELERLQPQLEVPAQAPPDQRTITKAST